MRSIILPLLLLSLAALTSCKTYYIIDAKHGRSIVAGDRYNGHIYHQDPADRPNAMWKLQPIKNEPGYYFIRDTRHYKYIVAGDNYDGNLVYHQDANNRPNAKWRLVPFMITDSYGSTTYEIRDLKHNRAIVEGDVANNNVYRQIPDGSPNAFWAVIPNTLDAVYFL